MNEVTEYKNWMRNKYVIEFLGLYDTFKLDRIIDTLDEPMSTQLSILVLFLTILFIYTHTSDDTPGK